MFNTKKQKELKAEILAHYPAYWQRYYKTKNEVIVKFPDGKMYPLEKLNIQTSFWFGEHGFDFDEMQDKAAEAEQSVSYFIKTNLRSIDGKISSLVEALRNMRNGYEPRHYYSYASIDNKLERRFDWVAYEMQIPAGAKPAQEQELTLILAGLWYQRRLFIKRLRTYLKRYGLSKVTADTYWADR